MTAILGFGKLIRKLANDDPRMLQVAQSISREGSATEEMLTRFLEFAQPTNFSMNKVELVQLVTTVIEGSQAKSEDKGISIEFSSSHADLFAWGDQLAIRQVVSNLLGNAIEASPPGDRVLVGLSMIDDEQSVAISISDHGPGVPEHIRHKVFSPFFTTKKGGTGLGLCTVRKFVSAMNGSVDLNYPEDGGLRVVVRLPCAHEDARVRKVLTSELYCL
jgi:signal transduction histidine kinase